MDHRIVSLIASATEIVCALGYKECLVGRSHECDFPETIQNIPVCSSSKVVTHSSSLQIDLQVKEIVGEGLSVYNVDSDLLDQLSPSIIITQTQCEVCAVSLKDVEEAVCKLVSSAPAIVSLEPMSLEDVWADIQSVSNALGSTERGISLVRTLKDRLTSLRAQTSSISYKPSVACIEWTDPLMIAANWVPTLVEYAGGENLISQPGKHSGYTTMEDLVMAKPDVIAVMPCGFDIDRCLNEMEPITSHPKWKDLPAVKNNRVYITDGNQYFNRPGPRVVESAEIIAECLHPDVCDYGHHPKGWIQWDFLQN